MRCVTFTWLQDVADLASLEDPHYLRLYALNEGYLTEKMEEVAKKISRAAEQEFGFMSNAWKIFADKAQSLPGDYYGPGAKVGRMAKVPLV